MESKPKKTFEDHWAEAFKDASMVPPDQCWDNIEKELDKKEERKPFLLVWRNKGLASGIAAMLLLTLGYVLFQKNGRLNTVKSENVALKPEIKASEKMNDAEKELQVIDKNTAVVTEKVKTAEPKNNLAEVAYSQKPEASTSKISIKSTSVVSTKETVSTAAIQPPAWIDESKTLAASDQIEKTTFGNVTTLAAADFEPYGNRFNNKREKLSYEFPENTDVVASDNKSRKGFWMGLNSGVSPFNPNYSDSNFGSDAVSSANKVSSESFNYASSSSVLPNNRPSSQPTNQIQNGRAVNIGITMGKKLSKRLGLESGFRYLRANSSLQTNVYAINENTGEIQAYFQANYLNQRVNTDNTIISLSENGNQAYDYMSIPMQMSYQIPILKKLDLQLLGGLSGDLFLRSVLSGANSGKNTLTASNSTYKSLNVSGLGGARLNYAVGKNWEAVFGSFYQHSLNSGLKSGNHLSFKPKMFGLTYGLNYKF